MTISEVREAVGKLGIDVPEERIKEWGKQGLVGPYPVAMFERYPGVDWGKQIILDVAAIDLLCVHYGFDADAVRIARGFMLEDLIEGNDLVPELAHVADDDPQNYLVSALWVLAIGKAVLGIRSDELAGIETWVEPSEKAMRAFGGKVGETAIAFRRVEADKTSPGIHPWPIEFVRGRTGEAKAHGFYEPRPIG
jgi:hypothetical protein